MAFPRNSGPQMRFFLSTGLFLALSLLLACFPATSAKAQSDSQIQPQMEQPDRRYLFREDKYKRQSERQRKQQLKQRRDASGEGKLGEPLPFDINAATLTYDSTGNVVNAEGDVIITYSSLVAEAQRARVNIETNQAEMSGDVRISDVTANLLADSAKLNMDTGAATLDNAEVFFEEGDYRLFARQAERQKGDSYELKDAVLSTCQCPEDETCLPWSLRAEDAKVTRNGYGEAWNAKLAVNDVPVFYFPYLFFPAKTERQSGLLPATFGAGRRSGADLSVPLYLVFDRSSDMTLTGLYESNVHSGAEMEYRHEFSRTHQLETGHIYLNESQRDGDLLGTNTDGLYDSSLETNRYGGWLDHTWYGPHDIQYIMRGRYVSDDLFVREYENDNIAPYNARFVTSQAVLRTPVFDTFSADLSAEYNQSLVSNDDLEFQRIPELSLTGSQSYNMFGENPLGLRLVSNTSLDSTYFTRADSYTGLRSEAYQRLKFPFHFRNYFDGTLEGNARATNYDLTETLVDPADPVYTELTPEQAGEFPGNTSRLVPSFNASVNSVLEKVFNVSEDNVIKQLGDLGSIGRYQDLVRVKHTIEPGVRYRLTPEVDQSDNPIFDAYDHLPQRNVMTYGVTQRLYGRYNSRNEYVYGIEETAPEITDIPPLREEGPLDPALAYGLAEAAGLYEDYRPLRQGSVLELANLKLYQSYDFLNSNTNTEEDPEHSNFSDLGGVLSLFPNEHVILRSDMDLDVEEQVFRSYSLRGVVTSKRGDSIHSALRFVENNVRQLESGLELRVTERIKVGYYSRFDDLTGEFIEQKGGIRFSSSCRCWVFDLLVSDKLNPDETKLAFNITLVGLGQLGNTFFTTMRSDNSNQ